MIYTAVGTPGEVVRQFFGEMDDAAIAAQLRAGEVAVVTDTLGDYTVSPDGKSLIVIVPPLTDLQDARWVDAKNYRDQLANGTCTTSVGVVQCDDSSKLRINGAVNMAMLALQSGEPFSIDWTLADNSVVTLDAPQTIAMGVAVGGFVSACQANGTSIRNAIYAAADADALAAIDITAGYPS